MIKEGGQKPMSEDFGFDAGDPLIDNGKKPNENKDFNNGEKAEGNEVGKDGRIALLNKHIDDIIDFFENSSQDAKNFNEMMKKLDIIGWNHESCNSWNQEQVDKVLEIYEKNIDNYDNSCPDFFDEMLGHGDVSYLVANNFIKRLESGKEIPVAFLSKISGWAGESLVTMDSDTASEFLLVLISNSDQVDKSFLGEIFSNFELGYLERFVREFSGELYKNKDDVYKTLKNIEILEYFKHMIEEQYFEEDTVKYNLNSFRKDNTNYFINFKIDQILEFYNKTGSVQEKRFCLEAIKNEYDDLGQEIPDTLSMPDKWVNHWFDEFKGSIDLYFSERNNKKRKDVYDNREIRKDNDIEPAIFKYKGYTLEEKDKKIDEYCYTKISSKYGIIYSLDGEVDSFFELNNRKNIEKNNLTIKDILDEEGFKKETMNEEEYKKMVLTYKTLIELPMREKIENEFGIELKDFNIREQVQFVNFLSSKSIDEVEQVKEFLNQANGEDAKNNRIKSFLSLESGEEEMGEKILTIGEKLDAESADKVFAKYAEIIGLAEKSRTNLESLFKDKKEIDSDSVDKIIQNLLDKGKRLLVLFSDKAKTGKNIDQSSVLKELEAYKTDLALTACAHKGMKSNNQEIRFEDLKGVTFEQKTAAQILENSMEGEEGSELDQMKEIYARNYERRPEFGKILLDNFQKTLEEQKEKSIIYMYKKDGNVLAFLKVDNFEDGKHLNSFNVDSAAQNSRIGDELFGVTVEKEGKNSEIMAACDVFSPATMMYIEKGGFVAEKFMPGFVEETNESSFIIKREKEVQYKYQGKGADVIIKEYEDNLVGNKHNEAQESVITKFEFNSAKSVEETAKLAEELINEKGYVMTRYFCSSDKKDAYCIFEKKK